MTITPKVAAVDLQARLAAMFFPRCRVLWNHADEVGISVEQRREEITTMVKEAVQKNHGSAPLMLEIANSVAKQICKRLEALYA